MRRQGPDLYSRAAATYNRVGPRQFTHFAHRIVDMVAVEPGDRILDVATGTGEILLAASARVGEQGSLVGVDASPAMLERAREEAIRGSVTNIELRQGDARRLDLRPGSFDAAFCGFALRSVGNDTRVLNAMARGLRVGGRLGLVEAPSWFFQHDSRWAGIAAVFRDFGVAIDNYDPDGEGRMLAGLVAAAGLYDVRAVEEECPLTFDDENQWWQWMWSHGSRSLLEAVPKKRLGALRRALEKELPSSSVDEDRIHGRLRAHLIVAAR